MNADLKINFVIVLPRTTALVDECALYYQLDVVTSYVVSLLRLWL
jgi:hypothetical protein